MSGDGGGGGGGGVVVVVVLGNDVGPVRKQPYICICQAYRDERVELARVHLEITLKATAELQEGEEENELWTSEASMRGVGG